MSGVTPPPPPPGTPPPPPRPPAAAPPLPYIDPDQLRPTRRWYWVAGAFVVVGTLLGLLFAVLNAIDQVDDPHGFQLSLESYICSIGGGGIGAIIGGVTWSRRTEHRRSLQRQAMPERGGT